MLKAFRVRVYSHLRGRTSPDDSEDKSKDQPCHSYQKTWHIAEVCRLVRSDIVLINHMRSLKQQKDDRTFVTSVIGNDHPQSSALTQGLTSLPYPWIHGRTSDHPLSHDVTLRAPTEKVATPGAKDRSWNSQPRNFCSFSNKEGKASSVDAYCHVWTS